MQNCITVQTLPPELFRQIQVNLTFHYVRDLVTKCADQFAYNVQLFYDKECKYEIDSQQTIQQTRLNNIIYAKRINPESTSFLYPKVTCWFKQDGIELNQGVILSSDFTFEEVIDEAFEKNIINQIPSSIKVTDYEQTKIIATLIQMQMCKLIDSQDKDPQLIIHFTTTNLEPQVQLQQKNQFLFQYKPPQQQQFNQNTLQNFNQQRQQFNFHNFSLQSQASIPQNTQYNPFINFGIKNNQQIPKFQQNFQQNINTIPTNIGFQNINSNQQESQIIQNETIESLENKAIRSIDQMIVLGKFSFQINEKGDFVAYQCSSPQISGYYLQIKGKKGPLQDEKIFKWENKFGVQIADNLGKGFVIKWKNNTYSSLIIYLI